MISDVSEFKLFLINKTFSKPIDINLPMFKINKMTTVGMIDGILMFQNCCILVAPSTLAASCSSGLTPANASKSLILLQPRHCHSPHQTYIWRNHPGLVMNEIGSPPNAVMM